MRVLAACCLSLALVMPAAAFAQPAGGSAPAAQEVVFTQGEVVEGAPSSSPIEVLTVPRSLGRTSLIKIRTQFVDAIVDSARSL